MAQVAAVEERLCPPWCRDNPRGDKSQLHVLETSKSVFFAQSKMDMPRKRGALIRALQ